jgi:hypothetical protein
MTRKWWVGHLNSEVVIFNNLPQYVYIESAREKEENDVD